MQIVLSTRNPSKVNQIRPLFTPGPFSILTLADAGFEGEAVEDGKTLHENALKKARFVAEYCRSTGAWAMAEDTGLFITALGGRPGIKAARWAGEDATTDEITQYTLRQLQGERDRRAVFEAVVAVISPLGEHSFFSGEMRGTLLEDPRVRPQPKMPYSPLFVPEGSTLVLAEMSIEHENALSHRGKAFREARRFLENTI